MGASAPLCVVSWAGKHGRCSANEPSIAYMDQGQWHWTCATPKAITRRGTRAQQRQHGHVQTQYIKHKEAKMHCAHSQVAILHPGYMHPPMIRDMVRTHAILVAQRAHRSLRCTKRLRASFRWRGGARFRRKAAAENHIYTLHATFFKACKPPHQRPMHPHASKMVRVEPRHGTRRALQ